MGFSVKKFDTADELSLVQGVIERKTTPPPHLKSYQIREVDLDHDLTAILPEWRGCNERCADHLIVCDPEWLQERARQEKASLRAYVLEKDSRIGGTVALELYTTARYGRLGSLKVVKFPLKVCRMLGYTPNVPTESAACDLLFHQLLGLEFDGIYMTCIRGDSFFWQYLQSSPLIKQHFRLYSQHGARPHPYIRLTGSYDDYLRTLSSKERQNLSRRVRKLRERGEVESLRITEEAQVDPFVEAAAEISRKTYQFRLWGMGVRNPDQLKRWLKWAARRGWLRSYLLKCGGIPCAFQVAYQYGGRFLGVEVGYDPGWRELGVGMIQQFLALEDVFRKDTPEICDFGAYADYKQVFANASYPNVMVWLFRRQFSSLLKLGSIRFFSAASGTGARALHRLNMKAKVQRWLRK